MSRWLGSQRRAVYASQSRILVSTYHFAREVDRFRNLHAEREALFRQLRAVVYDYYTSRWIHAARVLVDKENLEPTAFPDEDYRAFVDTVLAVLPEMKLLLMIREPVPTIWSMMRRQWGHSLTEPDLRSFSLDQCVRTWCASADLIRGYAGRPGVLVCKYEELVDQPARESRRVLDFLSIGGGSTFRPRASQPVGFSDEDRETILRATRSHRDAIYAA
jgi:hypothetical protein